MTYFRFALGIGCFGLIIGCLTETVLAGSNLVKNPSFETDANADGVPDGWTHGAGHFGRWQEKLKKQLGTATLVDDQAASGKRSICISVPKNNEGKNWNQGWNVVPAEGGNETLHHLHDVDEGVKQGRRGVG